MLNLDDFSIQDLGCQDYLCLLDCMELYDESLEYEDEVYDGYFSYKSGTPNKAMAKVCSDFLKSDNPCPVHHNEAMKELTTILEVSSYYDN